jgi:hypothetical protein
VFVVPEPEPVAAADLTSEDEPERVAAEIEIERVRLPLRVVAWDEDAAFELVEGEASPFTDAELTPEPVAAEVASEPEPVAAEVAPEPLPEPMAADATPEPEFEPPVRLAPISDTILRFPTRPAAPVPVDDERAAASAADSPEVAARRAQLDMLGLGDPGQGPVAPERPQPLPYRSRGAGVTQADLARAAGLRGSFWEASAREVAGGSGQIGVQACGQCGLSLSANARFCRRCGTRQAQSA